ncbi:MAG: hypothetical protein ACYC35_28400 [Pirellulales bacterium]
MAKRKKRRRDGLSYRAWDNAWYTTIDGRKQALRDEHGAKIHGRNNEEQARHA